MHTAMQHGDVDQGHLSVAVSTGGSWLIEEFERHVLERHVFVLYLRHDNAMCRQLM